MKHITNQLISNIFIVIAIVTISIIYQSCSDDEPKTDGNYPSLEYIAQGGIWCNTDVYYVGSNGKVIKDLRMAGGDEGLRFELKDGVLFQYYGDPTGMPFLICVSRKPEYNHHTGEMYVIDSNNQRTKFFNIVSYDPVAKKMTAHAYYGKFVQKGMLDDRFDTATSIYPDYDSSIDEGSYSVITLEPATSPRLLEELNEAYQNWLSTK